jgi:PqqD family protein of HPr-rel-A system
MTPPPGSWRLNPRLRLTWRDWGHDSVAYEALSGGTYQFDPLAAAVVSWFEEAAHDADTLCRLLAEQAGTDDAEAFRDALSQTLELLARLGWIEPADTDAGPGMTPG